MFRREREYNEVKQKEGGGGDLSVVANGEGVAAAGNDGADGVGIEGFDGIRPVFLFVVPYSQLPILS